jgi:hypothetical protein
VLQVVATRVGRPGGGFTSKAGARAPDEARLVSVKTRKAS